MRRWLVSAILLAACAGGQTGEITDLTACHEPVGTAPVDAPSAAGRSAREQLDELASSAATELAWQGAPASAVEVGFALTGEPGTLLGGSECARPWLAAPVTLTLRTADGALDESLSGTALFADTGAATVEATVLVRELAGALALDDGRCCSCCASWCCRWRRCLRRRCGVASEPTWRVFAMPRLCRRSG